MPRLVEKLRKYDVSNCNSLNKLDRLVCIAPMMDWTDRHCRYFLRLISRHILLYTEMVPTGALIHGDRDRFLVHDPAEHPLALQLGGSDPQELARCARMAETYGFDEINLNVGCPSDNVQRGRFGACLMAEPELVACCLEAMNQAVSLPITVKTRLGIDHRDSYEDLCNFISWVMAAGCKTFILHARKAWLKGLSPKENRERPPLRHEVVHQLKGDFPHLEIIINGGFTSLTQVEQQLQYVDGVMIGRAAYHNPYLLAAVDQRFYGDPRPSPSRAEILRQFTLYVRQELSRGTALHHMTRHVLGLFQGQPGARRWRKHLSEQTHRTGIGLKALEAAAEQLTCV
jgi:tRNA-dihydrouridine synthase A